MTGVERVFFVYAELLDEARRRARLRFAAKAVVDGVVSGVQRWAWGQLAAEQVVLGFDKLAAQGFALVVDSERVVEADALAAAAWLARSIVLTVRALPMPSVEGRNALHVADGFIVSVFDRTGLIGRVSVPGLLAAMLGEPEGEEVNDVAVG